MYKEYPHFHYSEVADYGRKSRTDNPLMTLEEILETHNKIMDEYARKHFGGPILEENKYREVVSGESLDSRPEITRLLKAIESPRIKAILTVEVQRLSRGDLEDAGKLIKLLRYTNTYVITPNKIYDLRDEYDRDAFERELKRGNEYLEYYKKIQARGKLASVAEGNYVGSVAPYGFERVKVKDGKKHYFTLKEKPEEADVVRMIFDWYTNEEIGTQTICKRLESMGIQTKNKGKHWEPSIIFAMLENVHYIGMVRWNWRKTIKVIEDQEVRELRPKAKVDEYYVFKGKHDGLVSEEIFYKAAEIRKSRIPVRNDVSVKNPFVNLVYCKGCGSRWGLKKYEKGGKEWAKPRLRCHNQRHCHTASVRFEEFEEYVLKTLVDCIDDFQVMVDNGTDDSAKIYQNIVSGLEKKLKELEQKEIAQWDAQYDPENAMPPHIFKKLNEKLLEEKEQVTKMLNKTLETMPAPVDYKSKILKFTDAVNALKDPNINAKIKNRYLREIIDKIVIDRASTKEPCEIRIKLKD